MFKSVKIHTDNSLGTITISSRPAAYVIILFTACLMGLCSLPFSEYHTDYFAYISVFFVLGLSGYYAVISIQSTIFENKTTISIRKGFHRWTIPFDTITGGYTAYNKTVSRQSLAKTHYLNFELQVNLPNNQKYGIRNGKANIFHYGFNQWGEEQEKIREKFNDILEEKGIPNLTLKSR